MLCQVRSFNRMFVLSWPSVLIMHQESSSQKKGTCSWKELASGKTQYGCFAPGCLRSTTRTLFVLLKMASATRILAELLLRTCQFRNRDLSLEQYE